MLLTAKKLLTSHLLPHGSVTCPTNQKNPIFTSLRHLLTLSHHLHSSAAADEHFVVGYLVNSCGLSRRQAISTSKLLTHIKSPEKPDSVLDFLKKKGLVDADIRSVVLGCPTVLSADIPKTLEPKIRALQDAGYSGQELVQLISRCPSTLKLRGAVSRIDFWVTLLGTKDKFLNTIKTAHNPLGSSLDKKIMPNIALLRECGISTDRIAKLIQRRPRLLTCRVDWVKSVIERVCALGIRPGSGRFELAFYAVANLSRTSLESRFNLFKGFGWSEEELLSAFRKNPAVFRISEKKLKFAMEFLLKEAGCPLSYVVNHPVLLSYSVEKRLIPRYRVLKILKSRGLKAGEHSLLTIVQLTDDKFMERYVVPYGGKVLDVYEAYLNAYAAHCPKLLPTT